MAIHRIALVIVFFANTAIALGQITISNNNLSLSSEPSKFGFTVYQDATRTDRTGINLSYNGTHVSWVTSTADEGSDWYVVEPGDVFSPSTIAAGDFAPIYVVEPRVNNTHPFVGGGDFYLGISTGQGIFPSLVRDVFGWVHLRRVGQLQPTVVMVENVMSYDSPGLVVGTTRLAPEPPTFMLACGGLFSVAAWTMNRKRGRSSRTKK